MDLTTLDQDVPADLARRAHQWTSHVPDERATQEIASYVATLRGDWQTLSDLADTDDKRSRLESEFERYRQGFRERTLAMLAAKSRCASWMVTGRSGFASGRAEKANNVADKRTAELLDFRKRALKAIRRVLCPEEGPIRTGDADAGERIADKIASLEATRVRMKAANAAIRRCARAGVQEQTAALMALGFTGGEAVALLTPDFAGRIGFAPYQLQNLGAEIRRLQARAVVVDEAKATPAQVVEGAGARVEDVPAENRVRLFFPGKPSLEVRTRLKSSGFRWTPSLGCWQAYRNPRALETAAQTAGVA